MARRGVPLTGTAVLKSFTVIVLTSILGNQTAFVNGSLWQPDFGFDCCYKLVPIHFDPFDDSQGVLHVWIELWIVFAQKLARLLAQVQIFHWSISFRDPRDMRAGVTVISLG